MKEMELLNLEKNGYSEQSAASDPPGGRNAASSPNQDRLRLLPAMSAEARMILRNS